MSAFHWLVELALPSGSFSVRPVISDRPSAELDWSVHASVADLLAWKAPPRIHRVDEPCPSPAECDYLPSVPGPRRLTMAHFSDPLLARQTAAELNSLFPKLMLPWTESMRARFMAARAAVETPAVVLPPRADTMAAIPALTTWQRPARGHAPAQSRAA